MSTPIAAPREVCGQCAFDSDLYNRADTISSQSIVPAILSAASEGLSPAVLAQRPDDATWSIGEYIDHVREVAFGCRFAIESALAEPGIDLGASPDVGIASEPKTIEVDAASRAVETEYGHMRDLLQGLSDEQWHTPISLDGQAKTVGWFARHVLHDGIHHFADIGRIRHGFGRGAATETGTVAQLSVSTGGVPKQPVDEVMITARGVAGDAQSDRLHHGRPLQAVCLWSAEVLEHLRTNGHPIHAGNAGENVTVAGVHWGNLRPGSRLQIGSVPLLISAHAIPCSKNARWFSDRDFNRIHHSVNPGLSRLYAIPLASGTVKVGDMVTVEPSDS